MNSIECQNVRYCIIHKRALRVTSKTLTILLLTHISITQQCRASTPLLSRSVRYTPDTGIMSKRLNNRKTFFNHLLALLFQQISDMYTVGYRPKIKAKLVQISGAR